MDDFGNAIDVAQTRNVQLVWRILEFFGMSYGPSHDVCWVRENSI